MGLEMNAYSVSLGLPQGKRALRKPTCRLEDNIKINLRELGWRNVDWSHLAQNRGQWWALVNTVMNFLVP
jgi:hypothetical protein